MDMRFLTGETPLCTTVNCCFRRVFGSPLGLRIQWVFLLNADQVLFLDQLGGLLVVDEQDLNGKHQREIFRKRALVLRIELEKRLLAIRPLVRRRI